MTQAAVVRVERAPPPQADAASRSRAPEGALLLSVHADLGEIERVWREFERHADCTVFQSFDWLSTWQEQVGLLNAVAPRVVMGRAANGAVAFIAPFAIARKSTHRELVWLGSDLNDCNAPLLARGFAQRWDAVADLWPRVLDCIRGFSDSAFDVVRLEKMPATVAAQANPFAALETTIHPSGYYATPLGSDWETFYTSKRSSSTRRRDRTKRNRLGDFGAVAFSSLPSGPDAVAALDVLVAQKSATFASRGIPNFFAKPGYLAFYRALASSARTGSLVHVSELRVGSEVAAASFCLMFGGRYYYLLSSYTDKEMARFGPGAVHLHELMRYAIGQGVNVFDFTIGDETYKRDWCEETERLYDHIAVASWRGALAVLPMRVARNAKRTIKQTPVLWAAFTWLRKATSRIAQVLRFGGRSAPAPGADAIVLSEPSAQTGQMP
ncbi:MAG TPA: GNAT family N-acetyltransferase [Pseudolabrys sp.]|uniref:GNAT family N-acetyltransferase n=1 Tax=Pseudolabrys sp. TaxID=1960880 RepID=UPI002DDD57F2|nr:GNAT family N-acetyltransferase [Pseudolabrys sp.]HEV2629286.1 GNAT family N-acetyltransferase [Pseudolabrys sp.]